MAEPYKKPCLDSSLFIAGLGEGEIVKGIKRHVVFKFLWDKAKAGAFPVFVSSIALAEVFKMQKRLIPTDALLDDFLEHINEPFVQIVEVDRETGILAHGMCRQYADAKLLPNDAIHLACALRVPCDVLLVWDRPLSNITHPNIRIEEPIIYARTLFTDSEIATPEEVRAYAARIASEETARDIAATAKQRKERIIVAARLAQEIVSLHKNGDLPSPFGTKNIRGFFTGQYDNALLDEILAGFCVAGYYAQRGQEPKFKRVAKGRFSCL